MKKIRKFFLISLIAVLFIPTAAMKKAPSIETDPLFIGKIDTKNIHTPITWGPQDRLLLLESSDNFNSGYWSDAKLYEIIKKKKIKKLPYDSSHTFRFDHFQPNSITFNGFNNKINFFILKKRNFILRITDINIQKSVNFIDIEGNHNEWNVEPQYSCFDWHCNTLVAAFKTMIKFFTYNPKLNKIIFKKTFNLKSEVHKILFSPSGEYLAYSGNGNIKLIDIKKQKIIKTIKTNKISKDLFAFLLQKDTLIIIENIERPAKAIITFFKIKKNEVTIEKELIVKGKIESMDIDPTGIYLAITKNNTIMFIDICNNTIKKEITFTNQRTTIKLQYSKSGRYIYFYINYREIILFKNPFYKIFDKKELEKEISEDRKKRVIFLLDHIPPYNIILTNKKIKLPKIFYFTKSTTYH